MTITVTEAAAAEIAKSVELGGSAGDPLRIAARRNDDGSIEYVMGFDSAAEKDTRVKISAGVEVVIALNSVVLLEGTTLDYVELETGEFEFIFLNPNDPHYVPPKKDRAAPSP